MSNFILNDTLAADTVELTRWPLCRVLLMNDSRYPWIILVPARADMKEIHDLAPADQTLLISELDRASRVLADLFTPNKINVGALGNIVSQLHIHVVARHADDDAWPGPVWGAHTPIPYEQTELKNLTEQLQNALQ
ncbi:MAG: HIT domain-containing protein [Alphaproteobacteria bacterium]|nr:HIT domain-containing protein [Alphaproteobacteria bacterium]